MSFNQQEQRPVDLEDHLAKWYKSVGKDGIERFFTRMRRDHFLSKEFQQKCEDACNQNLDANESQNAFVFDDEVFSLSQMDSGAVTIWRGEARFPLRKPVTLPPKWNQTTFDNKGGFSKGSYNKGGYNKGGGGNRSYPVLVQGATNEPVIRCSPEQAKDYFTQGYVQVVTAQPTYNTYDEEEVTLFKPVKV